MKIPKLLLSTISSLLFLNSFAGTFNDPSVKKPTKEIKYWCDVRGKYQKEYLGDGGTLELCKAEFPANHCYYIPCTPDSRYSYTTTSIPVPAGVNIEEGQAFWARYENGQYNVQLLNFLDIEQIQDSNGVEVLIIKH